MFRLSELDCYSDMLTRLYKQELQLIVMKYERYRYEFNQIYNTLRVMLYGSLLLLLLR